MLYAKWNQNQLNSLCNFLISYAHIFVGENSTRTVIPKKLAPWWITLLATEW